MPEPIRRKPINFGGVILDENQIKNKRIEKGLNNTYIIEFKSGVTAKYEMQNSEKAPALNSKASPFNKMSDDKVFITEGFNIKGLTIEGNSKARDDITLHDCENAIVNTFNDNIEDKTVFDGGKYNSHFGDKNDKTVQK